MNLYDEAEIVWLHDRSIFPMVREAIACVGTRSRPFTLKDRDGRVLVGYAVLKPTARGQGSEWGRARFMRRYFYVMPYDFEPHRSGIEMMSRCEAVDLLSVEAGEAGQKTERSATPATPGQRVRIRSILKRAQPKPKLRPKPKLQRAARP